VLDERLVQATGKQVPELWGWVKRLDGGDRIWAIESAGGLGYLLAQQLLAAGEHVVDIPATFASRVRLLGTGRSDKNIHIAAVTQLQHRHSPGRAYYDAKRTQGLTGRAALRSFEAAHQ
jgi:hypothetical protein